MPIKHSIRLVKYIRAAEMAASKAPMAEVIDVFYRHLYRKLEKAKRVPGEVYHIKSNIPVRFQVGRQWEALQSGVVVL